MVDHRYEKNQELFDSFSIQLNPNNNNNLKNMPGAWWPGKVSGTINREEIAGFFLIGLS